MREMCKYGQKKKFKGFETNVEEKLHCGWPSTKPRNTQNSLFFSPLQIEFKGGTDASPQVKTILINNMLETELLYIWI